MENMEKIDGKQEKLASPEVKFELPSLESETNSIFNFCYTRKGTELDWAHIVYQHHPKLKEAVLGITDKKEFYSKCREYVADYLEKNKDKLKEARQGFQESWGEVEEKFFAGLSKDFETDYSEEKKDIKANVSINPICPRFLETQTFNVFFKQTDMTMKQTCIHEIIHFSHFKKWLEVFPNYNKKTFNNPHSEWRLSEILVAPVMNEDKTIQEIIKNKKSDVYEEWRGIKIEGKSLAEYFGDIYKEHLEKKTPFEDFLKKSWDEYKKHKDIIEGARKD